MTKEDETVCQGDEGCIKRVILAVPEDQDSNRAAAVYGWNRDLEEMLGLPVSPIEVVQE